METLEQGVKYDAIDVILMPSFLTLNIFHIFSAFIVNFE